MRITVIGTGYVGLVAGACFAETGNTVTCADTDPVKIETLISGRIPIFEPGLEPLVHRNRDEGRLSFTTDVSAAAESADVVIVAVGTPPGPDGSPDMSYVEAAAEVIGRTMRPGKVVVIKSTVPVGTARRVRSIIQSFTDHPFTICSNPEFLKEGAAVNDFMKPDRVIAGIDSEAGRATIERLYAPFFRVSDRLMVMDNISAELTKYAANAMLATRISFMNEMANLAEVLGADIDMVRRGLGSDRRIGSAFLYPGPGYGGSCFPKDVRALISTAEAHGSPLGVVEAVERANQRQRRRIFDKLQQSLGGDLTGKSVAVWGLAFKAETDDVRESPAIDLVRLLIETGTTVAVFDPHANQTARSVLGDVVTYHTDPYQAVERADALTVLTEWLVFRSPDFERMRRSMRGDVIVDARNLYDPAALRSMGFRYFGVGRP